MELSLITLVLHPKLHYHGFTFVDKRHYLLYTGNIILVMLFHMNYSSCYISVYMIYLEQWPFKEIKPLIIVILNILIQY